MEQIIPHEKKCEKNPNRKIDCEKCLQEYNPLNGHDCVSNLLEKVDTLNKKVKDMEKFMGAHAYIFKSLK